MKKILIFSLFLTGIFCENQSFSIQHQEYLPVGLTPFKCVGYIGWFGFSTLALSKNNIPLALALVGIPCIDRMSFLTGMTDSEQQAMISYVWLSTFITLNEYLNPKKNDETDREIVLESNF